MRTKGGEALAEAGLGSAGHRWHVLWTRSNCEQVVHDQLAARGLEVFLPAVDSWCRRSGVQRLARVPLFAGYLFLRSVMDKATYLEVCKARGLVRMLGERWDRLDAVPESAIETIQKIVSTGVAVLPHPYLCEGNRVRITDGPLAGVEGVLLRRNPKKGLLVVSVDLLRRSVAVHLDCTAVEAA